MTSKQFRRARKQLRDDLRQTDRPFVDVEFVVGATDAEQHRWDDYSLLETEGHVVIQDQRDFREAGDGLYPKDDQGRPIYKLVVYRVTAKGFGEIETSARKWVSNILSNIPTLVASVVTALVIAWLTRILGL